MKFFGLDATIEYVFNFVLTMHIPVNSALSNDQKRNLEDQIVFSFYISINVWNFVKGKSKKVVSESLMYWGGIPDLWI